MTDAPVSAPSALSGEMTVTPPTTRVTDFPASIAIVATVLGAMALLLLASRFDATGGTLTISLLIVLAVIGVLAYSTLVTVPHDETTAAVVGALVMGFGGVVAYWLRARDRQEGDKS